MSNISILIRITITYQILVKMSLDSEFTNTNPLILVLEYYLIGTICILAMKLSTLSIAGFQFYPKSYTKQHQDRNKTNNCHGQWVCVKWNESLFILSNTVLCTWGCLHRRNRRKRPVVGWRDEWQRCERWRGARDGARWWFFEQDSECLCHNLWQLQLKPL